MQRLYILLIALLTAAAVSLPAASSARVALAATGLAGATTRSAVAAAATGSPAAPPTMAAHTYTRIFYFMENKASQESLQAHASAIDVLAPQSYALDPSGILNGSVSSTTISFAAAHGIKVMPLVVNHGFSRQGYQAFLDDPLKQDAALAALIAEAKKNGYWGWQVDFEQMDLAYRDRFSAFIAKAHDALQRQGLILSVAVIAQTSNDLAAYKGNSWQNLIGVYDYAALAANADFVSIMSYDDPESKGPVAEYPWLQRVLGYALKSIPANKISLGIPLYYWQWSDALGKRVDVGNHTDLDRLIAKYKPKFFYSVKQEAPYLTFKSHGKRYTVWYENARSMKKKIELIKAYGLHGFSAWALGQELPSIYRSL